MNWPRSFKHLIWTQVICLTCLVFTPFASSLGHVIEMDAADSLAAQLPDSELDSIRIHALLDATDSSMDSHSTKAAEFCNLALKLSQLSGYKRGEMRASYLKGHIHIAFLQQYQSAYALINRANLLATEIKDSEFMARSLVSIGYIFYSQRQFEKTIEFYEKALSTYTSIKKYRDVARVSASLVDANAQIGRYGQALYYFNKGYQITKERNFVYVEGRLLMALANVDLTLKKADSAILHGEKAANIFKQRKIYRDQAYCMVIIAKGFRIKGELGLALEAADSALRISKKYHLNKELMDSYEILEGIYSDLGDYKNAYEKHLEFLRIRDSAVNLGNAVRISNLEAEHKAEHREMEIQDEKKRQQNVLYLLVIGLLIALVFALIFSRQRNQTRREKKRSDELLLNILPEEVAEELKEKGSAHAQLHDHVTVMFTDFKDFTAISKQMSPEKLVNQLHKRFKAFDEIISKYQIEKIKTIGDSYMCASGVPSEINEHAEQVVLAALEIQDYLKEQRSSGNSSGIPNFEARVGIHTGPVIAGIVGVKKFAYDIWGDTVNTASRLESSGEPGFVNISQTTYDLVKDKFKCIPRGKIETKGKGEIEMYFVEALKK